MIKKLLLLLCLAIPLFAQVENTELQWTSLGYIDNGLGTEIDELFWHNDSLFALLEASNTSTTARWVSGTTWTTNIQWENGNLFFDPTPYTPYLASTGFVGNISYFSNGNFINGIKTEKNYSSVGGTFSRVSYTFIGNSSNNDNIRSATGNPSYNDNHGWHTAFMKDSLVMYAQSRSFDNDTLTRRLTLPLDGSTTTWQNGQNTNIPFYAYGAGYSGWYPLHSFQIGTNTYLITASQFSQGTSAYWASDTLYIYKSDIIGLTFTQIATINLPDGVYSHIRNGISIGDSVYRFSLITNDATENKYLSMDIDGNITEIIPPTNLNIYGGFTSSFNYTFITVNDQTVGDGNDSAKVYIMNPQGEWSWLMAPEVTSDANGPIAPGSYRTFNSYLETPNNSIFFYGNILQGPYSGIDADAAPEDYVFELEGFLSITAPQTNDVYNNEDIPITWVGDADTIITYWSGDHGNSWELIDTLYNYTYSWLTDSTFAHEVDGYIRILATDMDSLYFDETGDFLYIGAKSIEIKNPIDSTASVNIGATIPIIIRCVLIDTLNLFYSIGDSVNWIPIELGILPDAVVDTLTFNWTIPDIHGEIYLLATENPISSMVDSTERSAYFIGTNTPSQPAICWYDLGGNIIEHRKYNDVSCGWGSFTTFKRITAVINDFAEGYDYLSEDCDYPGQLTCVNTDPLYSPSVWVVSGIDTTETHIGDFYTTSDSISYKFRLYFVGSDSILYCKDQLNGYDSLVVVDLSDYLDDFISLPTTLTLYNVQRSKIENDTVSVADDFESLNDPYFKPVLLISGTTSRGLGSLKVEALEKAANEDADYDIARLFTTLNVRRDYFRGIDPKARKSGR